MLLCGLRGLRLPFWLLAGLEEGSCGGDGVEEGIFGGMHLSVRDALRTDITFRRVEIEVLNWVFLNRSKSRGQRSST